MLSLGSAQPKQQSFAFAAAECEFAVCVPDAMSMIFLPALFSLSLFAYLVCWCLWNLHGQWNDWINGRTRFVR